MKGKSSMSKQKTAGIGFFHRYLTLWVLLCMGAGILIGRFIPGFSGMLDRLSYANISLPMTILIWIMIYPMMMKVDFQSVRDVGRNPKGLYITWIVNWLVKPFSMFAIAWFFFNVVFRNQIGDDLSQQYLAGAILLGAAPCTAMVFVWSQLTKGNPAYTVVQVATNNLILLIAFVPIVKLLLGVGNIHVPWDTLILSIVLYVVLPLTAGIITRQYLIKRRGTEYFTESFLPKFDGITEIGLLLTLVLIFAQQADVMISYPQHILLIAVPLILQTFLIFFITFGLAKKAGLTFDIAAPAGMIGASNFFELALAVAIAVFGATSPAALATTVGVLTEVPLMLLLVKIANKTRHRFPQAQTASARAGEPAAVKPAISE